MKYKKLSPEIVTAFQLKKDTYISDIPDCFKSSDFLFELKIGNDYSLLDTVMYKTYYGSELPTNSDKPYKVSSVSLLKYDYNSESNGEFKTINANFDWWLIKYKRGLFDLLSPEDFSKDFIKVE